MSSYGSDAEDAMNADAMTGAADAGDDDLLVLEEVDEGGIDLVLPVWEPTGEPRVDEALDELTRLDPGDVHQHAPVYADVHERLRDALSNLDAPS